MNTTKQQQQDSAEFASFKRASELNGFTRIYSGRDQVCRCGCNGTYAEAGTKAFLTRLAKLSRLIAEGASFEDEGSYLNVSFGNDRALTAYRG